MFDKNKIVWFGLDCEPSWQLIAILSFHTSRSTYWESARMRDCTEGFQILKSGLAVWITKLPPLYLHRLVGQWWIWPV